MTKKYYKGWYGTSASITPHRNGTATLVVWAGKRYKKTYNTLRGAQIALGKWGEGWEEVK